VYLFPACSLPRGHRLGRPLPCFATPEMAPKQDSKWPSQPASRAIKPRSRPRPPPDVSSRPRARTITTFHRGAVAARQHAGRSTLSPRSPKKIRLQAAVNDGLPSPPQDGLPPVDGDNEDHHMEDAPATRSISTGGSAAPGLTLPSIDTHSSAKDVKALLYKMVDYFEMWSKEDILEGPPTICEDLKIIVDRLNTLHTMPQSVMSWIGVSAALSVLGDCYKIFTSTWSNATHQALSNRLSLLNTSVAKSLTSVRESVFTSLVTDIQAVSLCPGLSILASAEDDVVSPLLSQARATEALAYCDQLHYDFQKATYQSEKKMLWLLIWQSLKTAFTALRDGVCPFPNEGSVDRSFFARPGVNREFRRLLRSCDAANPRGVEDMVGRYCRYIAQCQANPSDEC
jgi:hypothetical protein